MDRLNHPGRADRAAVAWQAATGTQAPYLVHDADPLALVADAWVRRYDEQGRPGGLEVAVRDTLARWRARTIELPDYYLVLGPWVLGGNPAPLVSGGLAPGRPGRVVPADAAAKVQTSTAKLASGRWWPELDRLLAGVDRVVPDQL